MPDVVRILLLADTHLGFDLPVQPRIRRRRRGHDFLANYNAALQPALDGEVDLVVHGGDVFHRSRVAASVAYQAFEPLARVADGGVSVYVVPGNHEHGRIPHLRFARHPGIHVFDEPRTFVADVRGVRVSVAGFPSERDDVRTRFTELVESTGWRTEPAAVRLLCVHQCVEGATVGPGNFTFTSAADVIRGRDVPVGLTAVLSGHIHRHQVLTEDLRGRRLAAPVLYPGSIERTSIAEADEEKGFMIVKVCCDDFGVRADWTFRKLPARPLVMRELNVDAVGDGDLELRIRALIADAPADAVLTIRVLGTMTERAARLLSAAYLRSLAPAAMNIEIRSAEWRGRDATLSRRSNHSDAALELPFS
ncbi:MAG: metallophosphoesterase [Gemmatimonadaceae bacterium]